jgi:hypothetical protein
VNAKIRDRTYFPCSARKRSSADRLDDLATTNGVSGTETPPLRETGLLGTDKSAGRQAAVEVRNMR